MYYYNTPVIDSLVSVDHTSETCLIKKENGNVLHFYRYDGGESGGHTGNTGRIYRREFDISTETWGAPELFYNTNYDDRNVNGGKLDSGRIVLFIWIHDYTAPAIKNGVFMYSDDDGDTWSDPANVTSSLTDPVAYGNIIAVPTKGYMKGFFDEATSYRLSVQFSTDGATWGDEVIVGDYTGGHEYNLSEPSYSYIGGGKIICICRDQNFTTYGSNYYQITSDDYGATWGTPVRTNIIAPYFSPAPSTFMHGDKLIVMGADRKSYYESAGYVNDDEGIWVYEGDPGIVFSSPTSYTHKLFIRRPIPSSDLTLYGYQNYVALNDHRYLIVFTDRYTDGTNEDANFYQFYLDIYDNEATVGTKYKLPPYKI